MGEETMMDEKVNASIFEVHSDKDRRDVAVEEYLLTVSDTLCAGLDHAGISKANLARRLGKTKGHVTQVLAANRNLTLRSVAEIADAMGLTPTFGLQDASGLQVLPDHQKRASRWIVASITYGARRGACGTVAMTAAPSDLDLSDAA